MEKLIIQSNVESERRSGTYPNRFMYVMRQQTENVLMTNAWLKTARGGCILSTTVTKWNDIRLLLSLGKRTQEKNMTKLAATYYILYTVSDKILKKALR